MSSKPYLGIRPAVVHAIEEHTRELLDLLSAHLVQHSFLLGERISLANCALLGQGIDSAV